MPDRIASAPPTASSIDRRRRAGGGSAARTSRRVRIDDVRFDAGSRALYATDASNYRQVPIGVVFPHDADDVLAAISVCREFGAPLLCRGGGTSLSGQCCNVAVVLDFSRYMSRILEIDPARRIARVQPGVVLDHLRNAAEKYHLTFGPDPATHDRCTLGGMIGNNSCGVHSVMAGKTDDNIEELDVVTYDGTRMKVGQNFIREHVGTDAFVRPGGPGVSGRGESRIAPIQIYNSLKQIADQYADLIRQKFPNIPRRVSGYNLNYLLPENGFHIARALVGSEGTCVDGAGSDLPPGRESAGARACGRRLSGYLSSAPIGSGNPGAQPIGLEGFDDHSRCLHSHQGDELRRPRAASRRRRMAAGRVRRRDRAGGRIPRPKT